VAAPVDTASQIFAIERPHKNLLKLYAIRCFLVPPFSFLAFPLLFFRYHTMRYRFDEEGISMRWGILFRREVNLNYARIQDIHLTSGILQRWLGLADIHMDLKVQSAGGGGASGGQEKQAHLGLGMHTGYFRGVDNAEEIRDLMRERLRALRDAGLGAPDQVADSEPAPPSDGGAREDNRTVLEELRAEARLFRQAAEGLIS